MGSYVICANFGRCTALIALEIEKKEFYRIRIRNHPRRNRKALWVQLLEIDHFYLIK
jgi:hypothetical protein